MEHRVAHETAGKSPGHYRYQNLPVQSNLVQAVDPSASLVRIEKRLIKYIYHRLTSRPGA